MPTLSTTQLVTLILAAVVHVTALIGLVVLLATGHVTWDQAQLPLGALIGVGIGVPLNLPGANPTVTVAPAPPVPILAPSPVITTITGTTV